MSMKKVKTNSTLKKYYDRSLCYIFTKSEVIAFKEMYRALESRMLPQIKIIVK